MPFVLLLGLMIGAYALYQFFLSADNAQKKAFFTTSGFIGCCLVVLFLGVMGHLPPIMDLLLLIVFSMAWPSFKRKMNRNVGPDKDHKTQAAPSKDMSRKEAFEILNLGEDASKQDIKDAYKRLMQKVHPDNQGSDWMAAKLNQARDLLLG